MMSGAIREGRTEAVRIPPFRLEGSLGLPASPAKGLIVFAHGSGSSSHSPRNRYVASALQREGLATLLFDLLTETEAEDRANVFAIDLLAERLLAATSWSRSAISTRSLPIGYFGASTGAAAALAAAASLGNQIKAIVSRGGRPDLAGSDALTRVTAPTLLIVGGRDLEVLALNRAAQRSFHCKSAIEIVPDATHLFEEPGALDAVIKFATDWFVAHLAAPSRRPPNAIRRSL